MQRESAKYLNDMLAAARKIQQSCADQTLESFIKDDNARDAVIWRFCVIGEGLSQLRRIDPETAEQITEYWRIIGFRNQLIHGYAVIQDDITWRVAEEKLPVLIKEFESLLSK